MESLFQRLSAIDAPKPVKAPLRILWVLVADLNRCDLMKQASAMAYVTLLSLIPSLVAIFCVLSLFSPLVGDGSSLIEDLQDFVLEHLASGSGESVVKYLDQMLSSLSLAKIGWSSFASVLITLVLLLKQIEGALNRIWLVHKGRHIFIRFMYFWTFLTLGMVFIAVAIGMSSGFDLKRMMGLSEQAEAAGGHIAGWLVGISGAFLFFFFLYKIVPNCFVAAKSAAIGAATSALLLNQGGRLYGLYVRDAKNYQTLYGALAQLPIFLLWLYICWIIILLGALVSWRVQEGFPKDDDEGAVDAVKTPLDVMRNSQIKANLPLIALLAIYRNFSQGTGRGLSGQELAHALRLPLGWVNESLEALSALGYVVAAKASSTGDHSDGAAVTDPCFPSYPATALTLGKIRIDLARPMDEWMTHWRHDLPLDIHAALRQVEQRAVIGDGTRLDQVLAGLPRAI